MKKWIAAALTFTLAAPAAAQPAELKLWRLDCGTIDVDNLGVFSDTAQYEGQKKRLAASCYLIQHGSSYLLWDTGVAGDNDSPPYHSRLKERIVPQLARIGVKPDQISFVGISHYHFDHTGQVADFPGATLLPGKGDWEVIKVWPAAKERFGQWLTGGGKVEPVDGDKDVFGDGRVIIYRMPGHTEGHQVLLVRLASGPVLLSGDQYHFLENRKVGGVPGFNVDRADTLASHDRFEKLAVALKAKVIIQHEMEDIAKLPAFPQAAE